MAPDVIFVLTDDQPRGLEDAMPILQAEIIDKGLNFQNAVLPTPLCSPNRASVYTGLFPHNHGVWLNYGTSYGAWPALADNEANALVVQMKNVGYRTGFFGKYTNKIVLAGENYVPPGWDVFRVLDNDGPGGMYFNYNITGSSPTVAYGTAPADYSTDVIADLAADFITNTPSNQNFFMHFNTFAPHAPFVPAPRHVGLWPAEPDVPALNPADMSDRPKWLRDHPLADPVRESEKHTEAHETMMAVDDAIGLLVDTLETEGRLANTLFIFMSDNGMMHGAHRISSKDMPYERSAWVPLYMRWDDQFSPSNVSRLTPSVDVVATIAEAAGVTGWDIDGRSYLSLNRSGMPTSQMANPEQSGHPAFAGYRTRRYLYVEWTRGEADGKELYDYDVDPYEFENKINDPAYVAIAADMAKKARQHCNPTPPGFQWRGDLATCATQSTEPKPPGPGDERFPGDPGVGKLLLGWNTNGDFTEHFGEVAKLRAVSAGAAYPANPGLKGSLYRVFGHSLGGTIPDNPFGQHSHSNWNERRSAASQYDLLLISYNFAVKQPPNHTQNYTAMQEFLDDANWSRTWCDNLAEGLIDIWTRYGTSVLLTWANEPDQNSDKPYLNRSGLWHTLQRKTLRKMHFELKSRGVTNCSMTTATIFNDVMNKHQLSHDEPLDIDGTDYESVTDRFDAIYYYHPDWKGTRTVANGYWSNAYDPNPIDFVQPGEMDPWGIGVGPVLKCWAFNSYCHSAYWGNGLHTSDAVKRQHIVSTNTEHQGGHFHAGNLFRFLQSLYGPDGLPSVLGEWGYPIFEYADGSISPLKSADQNAQVHVDDFIAHNIVGAVLWRDNKPSVEAQRNHIDWLSFGFRMDWTNFRCCDAPYIDMLNDDPAYTPGLGLPLGTDTRRKSFAAMWSRPEVMSAIPGANKPQDAVDTRWE